MKRTGRNIFHQHCSFHFHEILPFYLIFHQNCGRSWFHFAFLLDNPWLWTMEAEVHSPPSSAEIRMTDPDPYAILMVTCRVNIHGKWQTIYGIRIRHGLWETYTVCELENHHFSWVNQPFMAIFNSFLYIYQGVLQREMDGNGKWHESKYEGVHRPGYPNS